MNGKFQGDMTGQGLEIGKIHLLIHGNPVRKGEGE